MVKMAIVRYVKKKRRSRCGMALIGRFKNEWDTYDRYAEENTMVKNLEALRFKFLGTSRSRAIGADHTLYLFESMQDDGIRFNVVMKDKEIATLRNTDDFKTLLRVKALKPMKKN